jgi:hypothetical protein
VTDASGRFDVPAWHKWSKYDVFLVDPIVLVYTAEYEPIEDLLKGDPSRDPEEHRAQRYVLRRFKGTTEQRVDSLSGGLDQGCFYGGESQKSLFPMLKAIFYEVRAISNTPPQIARVHAFAVEAAYAALALDPSGPAHEAEVEAFIAEHLK